MEPDKTDGEIHDLGTKLLMWSSNTSWTVWHDGRWFQCERGDGLRLQSSKTADEARSEWFHYFSVRKGLV